MIKKNYKDIQFNFSFCTCFQ